jgi:hypothetical protein
VTANSFDLPIDSPRYRARNVVAKCYLRLEIFSTHSLDVCCVD